MSAGAAVVSVAESEAVSRLAPARLLVASCAASYLAFLAACAAQFLLPTLVAAWRGSILLEEVRITPLWLMAWGAAGGASLRWSWRYGPLLFGGLSALVAMAGASRAGRATALFLHHLACWNLVLLLAGTIPWILFRYGLGESVALGLLAALWLVLAARALISFAAPYTAARFPRASAVFLALFVPFTTILVVFWRANLRLPFRGPQNLLTLAGILGALAVLTIPAGALARRPRQALRWPPEAARSLLIAALLLIAILAAFPVLQNAAQDRRLARLSTPHYEFLYPADFYTRAQVEQLARERENLWPAMAARLGADAAAADSLHLRVFLYPTQEAKYTRSRSAGPFNVEGRDIFAVLNEQWSALEPRADAQALVAAAWGGTSLRFLEDAAAVFVAGSVAAGGGPSRRTTADWSAQITAEEGPYSLTQLSNAEVFISPLVRAPLAGEFAGWIGPDRLHRLYAGQPASSSSNQRMAPAGNDWRLPLEEGWRRHLLELASRWKPVPAKPFSRTFFKGLAFSHEGGIHSGYASERAVEVLRQLSGLGVDSVALMPFAFMPSAGANSLRMFTGESDEALDHITFAAHRAGLRVLLKPQIWLRGGQFSGDIRFRNEEDFRAWWRAYRQWILHYARLAELNGTDLLSVGTELQGISGREADWRRLIAEIRRVYHGPLTYASNWGVEFETLRFWDALDYIGLNNYYPLAESASGASEAILEARAGQLAARLEEVAQKWNKPIVFTEAGYPSHSGAAREPWNESAPATLDLEQQARCYEVLCRAFYRRPWFAGMFWWKWHSSGFGGGLEDRSYTPQGKPAAGVIQKWFRR